MHFPLNAWLLHFAWALKVRCDTSIRFRNALFTDSESGKTMNISGRMTITLVPYFFRRW